MSILQSRLLARAGGNWPELAFLTGARFAFVMSVSAPQERHFVEDMFLQPFQPEINHGSDKERDHLRKNQAPDDDQSEWTSRGSVLSKTERERHRTHQCGQCR